MKNILNNAYFILVVDICIVISCIVDLSDDKKLSLFKSLGLMGLFIMFSISDFLSKKSKPKC